MEPLNVGGLRSSSLDTAERPARTTEVGAFEMFMG